MVTKSDFTPEQWDRIRRAPLLVGLAISASEPSGLIGTLQEGMASAQALADAKAAGNVDALISAVVDDLLTAKGRTAAREGVRELIQGAELAEFKRLALEELRGVTDILNAVSPDATMPYRDWLNQIARLVAEAASEGGFLGFGGETVSENERATLAEISAALRQALHPY